MRHKLFTRRASQLVSILVKMDTHIGVELEEQVLNSCHVLHNFNLFHSSENFNSRHNTMFLLNYAMAKIFTCKCSPSFLFTRYL